MEDFGRHMVLRENGVGISRANKVSKGGGNCRKLTAKKGGGEL